MGSRRALTVGFGETWWGHFMGDFRGLGSAPGLTVEGGERKCGGGDGGGRRLKGRERNPIAARNLERERLVFQIRIEVPILPPVPSHRQPAGPRALHLHRRHVSGAGDVAYQHRQEYPGAADREPNAPLLPAPDPPVLDGHVRGLPDRDLLERLDREDEVRVRRVAPPAGGRVEAVVGRAEVCGGDDDGSAGDAPPEVLHAADLEAGAADLAPPEQDGAQGRGGLAVAALLKVSVPARAADGVDGVGSSVEGRAGGLPVGLGGGGVRGGVVGADECR
ncbi:zinc finger CCCH-type antiviral protein 1 [Striga asiatica]|uniref:Zinc finger CCCH-type antiviral protein 1 n=1 Tax=Striga asiatica TaxID=4170 RepID=A0A5A7P1Z1_STRAF|nr:zinc finger CCCH-type antiviral protein 1 [Striga asiatica]